MKHHYWNANGFQVAIVAAESHWDGNLEGVVGDWAAYIGATHDYDHREDTLEFVARHGCKLSEEEARFFFPQVPQEFHYRR